MHKYKQFKTFTLMFLGILFFLPIGVFAMGPKTEWFNSGSVVASQDSQTISVNNFVHSTSIRMRVYGVSSLDASKDYSFRVNFSLRTQGSNPYITQCGLNINNSYVSTSSLTYSRTSREIGSSFTDSSFAVTANYTMLSSYGDVPIFIQCDINDLFLRSNYTATATSGQGSIINSIDQNGQNIISNNNYNTDKQNANRDANTTRDIENRTSLFNGLQQTLSNILQNLQDKLNDVKTGISNVINTVGGAIEGTLNTMRITLDSVLSTLQGLGQSLAEDLSSIIDGIHTGFTNVINTIGNKINDLMSFMTVCDNFFIDKDSIADNNVLLSLYGDIVTDNRFGVTSYFHIDRDSKLIVYQGNYGGVGGRYFCFYNSNKSLISCSSAYQYQENEEVIIPSDAKFVRFTIEKSFNRPTFNLLTSCHLNFFESIFNKLFNSNTHNANTGFQSFIDDFANSEDYGGLQRVITSPLNMVDNFNSTCTPINLTFPHTNNSIQLPCIQTYLSGFISADFVNLIKLVVNGFICYRCVSQLLLFFHDLKDPHNDEIEVLDL